MSHWKCDLIVSIMPMTCKQAVKLYEKVYSKSRREFVDDNIVFMFSKHAMKNTILKFGSKSWSQLLLIPDFKLALDEKFFW